MKTVSFPHSRLVFAVGLGALIISLFASAAPEPSATWQNRVSRDLLNIYATGTSATAAAGTVSKSASVQSLLGSTARFDPKGRVQVDVVVDCARPVPTAELRSAGFGIGASVKVPPFCVVEGWALPAALPGLASVTGVKLIKLPAYASHRQPLPPTGHTNPLPQTFVAPAANGIQPQVAGAQVIDGNGITIMRADQYVSQTGVNGAGVTVGVMSGDDTNVAVIQSRGELPTPIQDLTPSGSTNPSPTDEGTMMLEEVHAVAPGATLMFCGPQSDVEYVNCVSSLAAAGASIIVDDLDYPTDDWMSSQSLIPTGVQNTLTQYPNVVLFTVSDNENGTYWEGAYAPVSLASLGVTSLTCPANGQVDYYVESFNGQYQQALSVATAGNYPAILQWADPWTANVSNFDVYVENVSTGVINCFPGAGAPQAGILVGTPALSQGTYWYVIATPDASMTGKFLKFLVRGDGATKLSLPTTGSIDSEQAFVPSVVTVGAVDGSDSLGNTIEYFSGQGPINLPLSSPTQLPTPLVVAPDKIYVDEAGTDFPAPNGIFAGTSAAAPNTAAVAALLRCAFPSLTPSQLTIALQTGAAQLGTSVPNSTFGYGRVDAVGALTTLPAPTISGATSLSLVGGSALGQLFLTISGTGALTMSASIDNSALIPTVSFNSGCTSSSTACSVTVGPVFGQSGTAHLTLIVADGAHRTASAVTTVTVAKPAPPQVLVTGEPSQVVNMGGTVTPGAVVPSGTGTLALSASSSNQSLLPNTALTLSGLACGTSGDACVVNMTPMANQAGTAVVTVSAKDAYGQSGQGSYSLTVNAPPSSGGGGGGGGAIDDLTLLMLASLALLRGAPTFGPRLLRATSVLGDSSSRG